METKIGGTDTHRVTGWDFAPSGHPYAVDEPDDRTMNAWELDGLMRYLNETAQNGVRVAGNPSRLETHLLPDGSEVVALYDTHGDVWRVFHMDPIGQ